MIYVPRHFEETDTTKLLAFIRTHNFATLIAGTAGEPEISHLPMLVDETRGVLRGHMARANSQWQLFRDEQPVVAVFHGPHHYVSPAWYRVHPSVPTWNYAAVHVSGVPRLIEDRSAVESLLADLVEAHESEFSSPWRMELPADYLDAMIGAIVCFEIEMSRVYGKFKLSQNRPAEDHSGIIAALEAIGSGGALDVARLMRERLSR
jgi:transcriptional regulator